MTPLDHIRRGMGGGAVSEDIFDRLMELWQQPWSEPAFGEAQLLMARLRTARTVQRIDVERLARAFDLNGVNWPKRWGDNDFAWLARQVAAEYARLSE